MTTTDPKPSFTKTYRRADGEHIGDEYGWVIDTDFFDDDEYPVELVEETWERTAVRTFWHLPDHLYSCELCEEDAVAWQRRNGEWLQVCAKHMTGGDGS